MTEESGASAVRMPRERAEPSRSTQQGRLPPRLSRAQSDASTAE